MLEYVSFNQATNLGFKMVQADIKGDSQHPPKLPRFGACHSLWDFFPQPSPVPSPGCYFEHVWYKAWTCWPFFGSLYNFGGQFWTISMDSVRCANESMADLTSCPRMWGILSCLDSSGLILVSQWLHLYFGWKRIHMLISLGWFFP